MSQQLGVFEVIADQVAGVGFRSCRASSEMKYGLDVLELRWEFAHAFLQFIALHVIGELKGHKVLPLLVLAQQIADQDVREAATVQFPNQSAADETRAACYKNSSRRKVSHGSRLSALAHDQQRDLGAVTNRVDGGAEDQILESMVPVGRQYDQVRIQLVGCICNLFRE